MSKHISHLHACSVLKVKLTNIKLLFINFEIVTTDENKSIKKQFFQTVIVNVYIYIYTNAAKLLMANVMFTILKSISILT